MIRGQQREPGTWDVLTWERLCLASCKMAPSPLKHRGIAREGGWLRIQPLRAQMMGLAEHASHEFELRRRLTGGREG